MSALQLPQEWVKSSFDEVSTYIQRGKGPKYAKEPNTFPVVNQKSIRWNGIEQQHLKYVDEAQWEKWEAIRFIREGDILWNSTGTGTIGRACYLTKEEVGKAKVVDSHVTIVRTSDLIDSKFVFYWIMHPEIQSRVSGLYTGTTNQVELSKTMVMGTEVPLPPLAEQREIADRLDTLLAQVDTLKGRLDALPAILKRFRQSVLAAAVSGKLTEEWRGDKEFPHPQRIGSVAIDIRYGTSKKCSPTAGQTPVLRIPNIGTGHVILDDLKYADFESKELEKLRLEAGDLLLIRSNGSVDMVGKLAVVTEADLNCLYAGYLIRVRLNKEKAHPNYAAYCLQSPQLRQVIELRARSTSGVNNINSKELAALEIPLPSLDEQTEIVRRVEQLFAFADQVEQRVKDAQSRVNHLTQSILAKAFRGELTADWREQHPELISGEHSAEALLARIEIERAAQMPAKRTRRKKAGA